MNIVFFLLLIVVSFASPQDGREIIGVRRGEEWWYI